MSKRITVKILGLNIPIDWLINWLLEALVSFLDGLVPGQELSVVEKKYVRTGNYLAKEWGAYLADQTETDVDDRAVETAIDFTEDTAEEGGFELPTVPPLE